ncbi:protein transporter Sec31 [Streptomyces sp. NPDC001520]|uniref:protein transporter Sec31 n=1 Tax=Streptomyces sp. NPDC001520 TaxID=3364581 RepID=UPI003685D6E3
MKTRTEPRTRQVPHTINGDTRMVDEHYDVTVPVPPRDWDHTVLTGVQAGAAAFVAASVAWTTANVGDLLAQTVAAGVAYPVAVGYDAPWVGCMALEWLARYDADRARAPRIAGHIALGIAMAAVIVHGFVTGAEAAGIVGAVISALAKGFWTLVMRHTARPLDSRTQQWLLQRRGEVGARLALSGELRQLARVEAQHAAVLASSGQPDQDSPDADQDEDPGQQDSLSGPARKMILARAASLPGATDEDIVKHLAKHGITVTPDAVRTVLDSRSDDTVRPLRPTITDTVKKAVRDGLDRDETLAAVRAAHGQNVTRDTVVRTLNRLKSAS